MPRFFFHLRENGDHVADEEGADLADIDAARQIALAGARSIMSDTIREGRLSLDGEIRVADVKGETILTLPFRDAVQVLG